MKFACIVPTRDRPEPLSRLFDSIRRADMAMEGAVRVIVVDNSGDGTARARLPADFPLPITYVHEPRPGTSRARNRGLGRVAADEHACLLDDDILLPETFFRDVEAVVAANPRAGLLGGRVELFDERDLPLSIKMEHEACTYHGGHSIVSLVLGCCAVVTRRGLDAEVRFDERLGPGTTTHSVEDVDFAYRLWKATGAVAYDPGFFVFHNHGRRTVAEARTLLTAYKRGHGAFFCKHVLKGEWSMLRSGYWFYRSQRQNVPQAKSQDSYSTNPNVADLPALRFEHLLPLFLDGALRFALVALRPANAPPFLDAA